jgi:hypothetical protein
MSKGAGFRAGDGLLEHRVGAVVAPRHQWQVPLPESVKVLPAMGTNLQS